MGRGRAKAKQTKVARELKYSSPSTDYNALQRELGSPHAGLGRVDGSTERTAAADDALVDDAEDDPWASSG